MNLAAAIRPDDWDFPLVVHVLGAMLLVGAAVVVLPCLAPVRAGAERLAFLRIGFRTLLLAALPGYVLMRAGAEWIKDKEDIPGDTTWIGIGNVVADGSLVLLAAATVLVGIAVRRARRGAGEGRLPAVALVLVAVSVAAYVVAVWAMTAKPT